MKSFLAVALVLTSFSTFAFEKNATLDLTNVYGNLNAGLYEVNVSFTKKTTLSKSSITTKQIYDDGMVNCTTSAQFEIGEMKALLVNKKAGWTKNITKKIVATVSVKSADENCISDLSVLAGEQMTYSSLNIGPVTLPVAAPAKFETVQAHLAPFAATFFLNASIEVVGNELVLDPSNMLDEGNVMETNSNNSVLNYFVTANSSDSALSLANGTTSFR